MDEGIKRKAMIGSLSGIGVLACGYFLFVDRVPGKVDAGGPRAQVVVKDRPQPAVAINVKKNHAPRDAAITIIRKPRGPGTQLAPTKRHHREPQEKKLVKKPAA